MSGKSRKSDAPLPPLTRLLMVAEALDGHAAISTRPGQMEELEALAGVLREIRRELEAAGDIADDVVRAAQAAELRRLHDAIAGTDMERFDVLVLLDDRATELEGDSR